MNTPYLLIFDMDGTLEDSQQVIVMAMQAAFDAVATPSPSRAAILGIVGLSLPRAMQVLLPDADAVTVETMVSGYKTAALAHRATGAVVPLYHGARDCLTALNAVPEFVLGVATGKAQRGVDHTIKTHDLHGLFATTQTADTNPSKPDPGMVLAACDAIGIPPGRALMIGDTSFDMEMGRAAGARTIAVSWGYHDVARLRASEPDLIVDSFGALQNAILEMTAMTQEV